LIHNVYRNIIIYAQGKNYGGYLWQVVDEELENRKREGLNSLTM
jgi:hypothetical protein